MNGPEDSDSPAVELFTDGACLDNPGPGGWAFLLRDRRTGREIERSGGEPETTNNRMEITAVLEGLAALDTPSTVRLCADSEYVVKGMNEWLPGWKRRGWRKSNKRPVLNADLWQRLDEQLQRHNVRGTWTRGHAGHPENERCDRLAFAEAERQREGTG